MFGEKGKRTAGLEKTLAALEARRGSSQTGAWQNTLSPYIKDVAKKAHDAWHATEIDGLTDSEIVRNLIAQRATVKALQGIIDFVEGNEQRIKQIRADLEKIEKGRKK